MKWDTQCGRPVSGARRMWTWREVIFMSEDRPILAEAHRKTLWPSPRLFLRTSKWDTNVERGSTHALAVYRVVQIGNPRLAKNSFSLVAHQRRFFLPRPTLGKAGGPQRFAGTEKTYPSARKAIEPISVFPQYNHPVQYFLSCRTRLRAERVP